MPSTTVGAGNTMNKIDKSPYPGVIYIPEVYIQHKYK